MPHLRSRSEHSTTLTSEQPPLWSTTQPPDQSKPARTIRLSHFLLAIVVLSVLLAVSGGLAISYSVQLQDYNRLQTQFKDLASQNLSLQNQVQNLKIQNANPTLKMWNSCNGPCSMSPGNWRVGGVPDTFDYNVSFTSTVPVTVYILTFSQYVQFANCTGQISCVTGGYTQYGPTTSLPGSVFTLAEGCSAYVAVFQSTTPGVINPDVSVTYKPSSTVTGVCT